MKFTAMAEISQEDNIVTKSRAVDSALSMHHTMAKVADI